MSKDSSRDARFEALLRRAIAEEAALLDQQIAAAEAEPGPEAFSPEFEAKMRELFDEEAKGSGPGAPEDGQPAELNAPGESGGPKTADPKTLPRKKRLHPSRFIAAAAAIFLCFAGASYAMGASWPQALVERGLETMRVRPAPGGQMVLRERQVGEGEESFSSLSEALEAYGLDGLAPTWIPSRYHVDEVSARGLSSMISIFAAYLNQEDPDDALLIHITCYTDPESEITTVYETSAGLDETYLAGGVEHYLFSNLSRNGVCWVNLSRKCSITGRVSEKELKKMVDSIYR